MKRFLSYMLALIYILIPLVSGMEVQAADTEPLSETEIETRIDELYDLIGEKYFTVSGERCYHDDTYKGGSDCNVNNILNTTWFRNIFGTIEPSQMFLNGGSSCMGFVEFAEWYIYRANDTDRVRRDNNATISDVPVTYAGITKYANTGDYLWYNGHHAMILVSYDSTGITVLDSNWGHDCKVQMHKIPYNDSSSVNICKLYSETTGRSDSNIPNNNSVTKITFSSLTTPGNLTEGQGGHINGYISSSNSPICSVTAEVYNQNGQRRLSASTSNFSVSRYGPIMNSKIDSNLKFGTLPAGTYYIKYTAKAKDGTSATATTNSFTVVGEETNKPQTYTVKFNANGGSVSSSSKAVTQGST